MQRIHVILLGEVADPMARRTGTVRTETILVVDDDTAVRRLMLYCLKGRGYTVLEASSGAQALEICHSYKGKISVALIDVIMPGIHGPQLERCLDKLRLDIRVIYTSGFPHIESINRGM